MVLRASATVLGFERTLGDMYQNTKHSSTGTNTSFLAATRRTARLVVSRKLPGCKRLTTKDLNEQDPIRAVAFETSRNKSVTTTMSRDWLQTPSIFVPVETRVSQSTTREANGVVFSLQCRSFVSSPLVDKAAGMVLCEGSGITLPA